MNTSTMVEQQKSIQEELTFPILLADRVCKAIEEAQSLKVECFEVGNHVDRISQKLRSVVRLATATPSLYERPIRRIVADVSNNLERALALIRKCKRIGFFRRFVTITGATDFRRLLILLETSDGDLKWLLSILNSAAGGNAGGIVLTLPPIASNDPTLSWVWSYVASIQMGSLNDRVEAANGLASLTLINDRNKMIVVEEGGVSPLLNLLKEGGSEEAQIAAATALFNLASNELGVRQIGFELGIPAIVQALSNSPTKVQIKLVKLVSRMAEHDPDTQEEFGRENAIRPLVSLLSFEMILDEPKLQLGHPSFHSIVQINKELGRKPVMTKHHNPHSNSSSSSLHSVGSTSIMDEQHRKERENEKLKLKISCAKTLWMLSKGSVSNSRRITETKGLLCLAKLIEMEQGELQLNCLMTVMEVTSAAECDADLRRTAFKTKSPASKAAVDQLLRVIQEESGDWLRIPAIQAIGSLALAFLASETWVIGPLVNQLSHRNTDVATEATIALGKFACLENFICVEHSKAIIEFNGVPPLMKLLRISERAQLHGLILLCYLALHVGNSEALEKSRALAALEFAFHSEAVQHPSLRELLPRAIYSLELCQAGVRPHRHAHTINITL